MIHFIPDSNAEETSAPGPYAEAIARLASIRQALACVEQFAGDEPRETATETHLAAAWPVAGPAHQRCYESRSARTAAAAAAGLETLAVLEQQGARPNAAALARLKKELAGGVDDIDALFSL